MPPFAALAMKFRSRSLPQTSRAHPCCLEPAGAHWSLVAVAAEIAERRSLLLRLLLWKPKLSLPLKSVPTLKGGGFAASPSLVEE